jgi:hypothetical protein
LNGRAFVLKGSGFALKGRSFVLKGRGFSCAERWQEKSSGFSPRGNDGATQKLD